MYFLLQLFLLSILVFIAGNEHVLGVHSSAKTKQLNYDKPTLIAIVGSNIRKILHYIDEAMKNIKRNIYEIVSCFTIIVVGTCCR